ncbi:AraC family transcriptional regulator of adaptative response/methylated-DNA-[protein]-cysteine methyltransferase [Sphingomonas jejuensis]|uniref:AraC family transcriptional regulator of adaptative response/methylated-DNA-[protein]-cysteine methyltransferase n=1 Tax=Sphingomonas jejuensis TaxID=904715 RepID=A0ABX0XK57_9SPHN|nr:methylated-DNA--[protein]-cysteine S-methyltransferase [Sphingomonas jejuensis]NJC33738.1 AraC family transcriptional regulator of adaptative response/methylated-DNA-[protein]-cysteine methyltransferase [Sphingomonas jejuensis]
MTPIDEQTAWTAYQTRDRKADGRFVVAITSTGIYCRPSCPARHARADNVRFFASSAEAQAGGFRACLRCRPDGAARDDAAVAKAAALIGSADQPLTLDRLAAAVGYAPHHFHRLFTRAMGTTPAAYARSLRAARAATVLDGGGTVTDAVHDAGFGAPSRLYAAATDRLGMAPSVRRRGAAGERIRFATAATSFGPMLLAATDIGICRLTFGEDEAALRRRFPHAVVEAGGPDMEDLLARAVAAVEMPAAAHGLPLDLRGTAFQEAVWRELARVPPGESVSYAALAARAGRPDASRAAGSACGANPVAVLVPCHRARRGDGSAGGYAWGLDMKAELCRREADGDLPKTT